MRVTEFLKQTLIHPSFGYKGYHVASIDYRSSTNKIVFKIYNVNSNGRAVSELILFGYISCI